MKKIRSLAITTILLGASLAGQSPTAGDAAQAASCPSMEQIVATMERLDLTGAARTARFSSPFPVDLYRKAAKKPGEPVAARDGDKAYGVLVAEIPLERLWMAVSDEPHHTVALPVRESVVIAGTARGPNRTVFQYYKRWGIGRWWASEVSMNRELYESSEGKVWETWWVDVMDEVDTSKPPIRDVAADIKPIVDSRGSWVFVSLGERCTLVEYFLWTDPGGAVGAAQRLLVTKSIRNTLDGAARMATDHVGEPHDGPPFLRPDGTPIE
jgi:hypothetical protein